MDEEPLFSPIVRLLISLVIVLVVSAIVVGFIYGVMTGLGGVSVNTSLIISLIALGMLFGSASQKEHTDDATKYGIFSGYVIALIITGSFIKC